MKENKANDRNADGQIVRVVLFDMDGTLLDTERLYLKCWKRVAKERGFELTDEFLSELRGASLDVIRRLFDAHFQGTRSYLEERKFRQKFVMEDVEAHGVPVMPGVVKLLEWLKLHRVPAAVATSTPYETASYFLEKSGLRPYFQTVVTGDMVEHGKPDPDIFLLAAGRVGVPIGQCAVAEDSRNGVIAARRAGALSCYLPDLTILDDVDRAAYTDAVFSSADAMIPWLETRISVS